jgi:two-component system phosphate regulon sensor histidine kinase PhoR
MASLRGLQHVISNLIDNAIKYCPPDSRVTVQAQREDGKAVISVVDNGPGIPEVHRDRIFERFYRIDAGRSRGLGGTGLGLSIVKHWVEAMGGTIAVAAAPGGGTAFRVELSAN